VSTRPGAKAKDIALRVLADDFSWKFVRGLSAPARWLVIQHVLRARMKFSVFFLTAFVGGLLLAFYRKRKA